MYKQHNLIYDVGLHKGEDTDFYLKKGFNVVAIEANPSLVHLAKNRFASEIDNKRLKILDKAVAESNGPIIFYVDKRQSVWGTTKPEWKDRNKVLWAQSDAITVQGEVFLRILKENGVPYYLKIDIEGADLLCLEALCEVEERPLYISIESEKISWQKLLNEFNLFQKLGYSKFKIINQAIVHKQLPPKPSQEGIYASHVFEFGSSGLFGEEAPGDWLSRDQAIEKYSEIFKKYELFGDHGIIGNKYTRKLLGVIPQFRVGWYDTHAKYDN
jgi:FkbM family methyltransferase